MAQIHIPISKEQESIGAHTKFQMIFGGFSVGLLMGILSVHPFFSSNNVGQTIAGVGNLDNTQLQDEQVQTSENILSTETAPMTIPEQENAPEVLGVDTETAVQPVTPSPDSISNTPIVDEKAVRDERIVRLGREIARIKDASVQLIAEFNQNCGVWTDECATPYATQLEKNNTAYDIAAKELETLTRQ